MSYCFVVSPGSSSLLLGVSVTISAGEPMPLSESLSVAVCATAGSPSAWAQKGPKTDFINHEVHFFVICGHCHVL